MCYCDQTLYQNLLHKTQNNNHQHSINYENNNNQWVSSWSSKQNNFQQNQNQQQNYNHFPSFSSDFQIVKDSQVLFQVIKSLYRYHLLTILTCILGPLLTRKICKFLTGHTNHYKMLLTSLHSTFVICLFLINGAQVYCLCVMIMIQIGKSLLYLVKNDNLLKKSRKISKCRILAGFLRILMYISALHDVGGHELSQVCGGTVNENLIRNDKKHRIFALQLLEYRKQ